MWYVSYDYYMSWYNYFYSVPTNVRSEGETKETEVGADEAAKEAMRAAINDPDAPELLGDADAEGAEGAEGAADADTEGAPEFQSSIWSQPRYLRQNVRKKNKKKK